MHNNIADTEKTHARPKKTGRHFCFIELQSMHDSFSSCCIMLHTIDCTRPAGVACVSVLFCYSVTFTEYGSPHCLFRLLAVDVTEHQREKAAAVVPRETLHLLMSSRGGQTNIQRQKGRDADQWELTMLCNDTRQKFTASRIDRSTATCRKNCSQDADIQSGRNADTDGEKEKDRH